jgi:hypothetical protein
VKGGAPPKPGEWTQYMPMSENRTVPDQ